MIRHRMIEAYNAALKSPDRSTQNGAVLYRGNQRIAASCNHIPIPDRPEYHERPLKYEYFAHAERSVIYKAAKHGAILHGTTMYCPYAACPDCAIAILLSGIKEIVRHKRIMDITPDRWRTPCEIGDNILRQGGVIITDFDEPLDCGIEILFNEKLWSP